MHSVSELRERAAYYFEKAIRLPRHRRRLRGRALAWLALASQTEEAHFRLQAARKSTHEPSECAIVQVSEIHHAAHPIVDEA
jgi:hypothetical protein